VESQNNLTEVTVVNLEGKEIKTVYPNAKKTVINTSGLKGIYLIRLTGENKVSYAKIQVL
jgi:hypothetical protein